MMTIQDRLYLNVEEAVRLRKILERIRPYLKGVEPAFPFAALRRLLDLSAELAPASKTKNEIKALLELCENRSFDDLRKQKALRIIEELHALYQLDQIKYRLKDSQPTSKNLPRS
jgi:hypothetical protein